MAHRVGDAVKPPVVILVGPQHPGNVGAAARGAANFGVTDFRVVAPRCDPFCDEAMNRAVHAKPLLEARRQYATLDEALAGTSMAIGTTARTALAPNHFLRRPSDIRDALAELSDWDGQLAWVFGREDSGLTQGEVERCDQLVTIPTADYNSLNLAHAVTLCCYESFRLGARSISPERTLDPDALAALNRAWDALVDETEDRDWRQKTARGVWRKMMGRSRPDTFEVHNVLGILSGALKRFGRVGFQTPSSQRYLAEQGKLVTTKRDDAGESDSAGRGDAAAEPAGPSALHGLRKASGPGVAARDADEARQRARADPGEETEA